MDLSIQTTPGAPAEDHSWNASGVTAFDGAQSGTLDVPTLTSGTHYDATAKTVPSGLAVARVGTKYVPFVPGGTGGAEVLAGFVGRTVQLGNTGANSVAFFALVVDAVIKPANLPVAAQRVINRSTPTSGKFAFAV